MAAIIAGGGIGAASGGAGPGFICFSGASRRRDKRIAAPAPRPPLAA
jgi:hypothetical protein